jgi:hypothetical protein
MALPSIFDPKTTQATLERLSKISAQSKPQWGKMNAAQMLAHLNVSYDLAYDRIQSNHNLFSKLILKLFVKNIVTNEKPYAKNSRTGPEFIVADERDFEREKNLFIQNIKDTEGKGASYFEGKKSQGFGVLTAIEWNNQMYKHIDHHFHQFGV